MSRDFLLEIGTEEIPHWMIPGALEQLRKLDVFGAEVHADATARRLTVWASGLPERTPDSELVVKGPSLTAGDKAAEGFAKKQGADVSALRKAGNYYELAKKVEGRAVRDLLAESLPAAILGLQWPKTMYWTGGKTGPRFIRPIRWLVALLGDQVIPFEIAGVKSGDVTRGHRILGSASIPVTTATYEAELRKNSVILSSSERRKKIEAEAVALGAKIDPELRETLTFITEYPSAIRGDFNPAFLDLPAEVLTTVMRHHQKYFSVESAPGKLASHFVAVLNTNEDPDGLVKQGNERVLKARFNDARFFWDVDQHKKLIDRVDDLAKVTFQAKLGSYKEKTDRVVALVQELGGNAHAQRAALLAKCDLTTDMVKEFTDLQGIVGGLYARAQGEQEVVAQAIYEHYKPLSMEDTIPSTVNGQILALADKLDTLRGCFNVGLIPSGSKDPFALRRAAQGVVKILANAESDISLGTSWVFSPDLLKEFLGDRARFYFKDEGFPYDHVEAVMMKMPDVKEMARWLRALRNVGSTPDFKSVISNYKRTKGILENYETNSGPNPGLFTFEAEIGLFEQSEQLALASSHLSGDYEAVLIQIASLRPALDHFFETVHVNTEDPISRKNRLDLLYQLYHRLTVIDLSEIVTSGGQK
ncbi:MAG: glycine--tRNA ligase subunit beta [Acidobacteriota bacterium]